jgi:hypothetical protein
MSLVEALRNPATLQAVAVDGAQMIHDEIGAKRGIRAAALKAGFKTMKKIKPGILEEALSHLLPEFAPALDPYFLDGRQSGDLRRHFSENSGAIAEAMLAVTDARAARASHRVLKRVYGALRGQARTHTVEAVPKLADLIGRHIPD